MPIIRVLEMFALFASSKKTRKLQACEKWEVSYVYQSVWRLTWKWQARELLGWTILQKFHTANYRRFTVSLKYQSFEITCLKFAFVTSATKLPRSFNLVLNSMWLVYLYTYISCVLEKHFPVSLFKWGGPEKLAGEILSFNFFSSSFVWAW